MIFQTKKLFQDFHENSGYDLLNETQAYRVDEDKQEVSIHEWDTTEGRVSEIVLSTQTFDKMREHVAMPR